MKFDNINPKNAGSLMEQLALLKERYQKNNKKLEEIDQISHGFIV